jgi:nucleotide sugar dehydrogenase
MKVCLFGLGRIGLPLALVCADSGYQVTGIDINEKMISLLKLGKTSFQEPGLNELLSKHLQNNFIPKHQEEQISKDLEQADYIIIAVGTEFVKYPQKPILSTLYSIIEQIIAVGIKNKTIILRVTLPIGTSDDVISFIEKKTRLKESRDFYFSFVPERLMEGKAISEERSLPKIIGAYSDEGYKKVELFFKPIGGDCIQVSNPRTAEFIKLIDNSWRSTKFAFANDLAYLAEKNHVNVIEAINNANRGYKRNAIPIPGPVSGYCLGKDPYILELAFNPISKKRGFQSVWFYGRQANDWLIEKVITEIKGNRILIMGLSFKEDIDDYRYSHAIEILKILIRKGLIVSVIDPYLNKNSYSSLPIELISKINTHSTTLTKEILNNVDTVIIATRHKDFNEINKKIFDEFSGKIIDLWNFYEDFKHLKNYFALGDGLTP